MYIYSYKIWWFSSSLREIWTDLWPMDVEMGPMALEPSLVERRLVEIPWNFNQNLECYWLSPIEKTKKQWNSMAANDVSIFESWFASRQQLIPNLHCCSTRWHRPKVRPLSSLEDTLVDANLFVTFHSSAVEWPISETPFLIAPEILVWWPDGNVEWQY